MKPRKVHKIRTEKYKFIKEFLSEEWEIPEEERGNIDTIDNASIDVVWESFQRFLEVHGYAADFCSKILLGKLLRDAGVEKIKRGPRKQQKFFYFPLKPVSGSHAEAIMASHCGGRYFVRSYYLNMRKTKPEYYTLKLPNLGNVSVGILFDRAMTPEKFEVKILKRICSKNNCGSYESLKAHSPENASNPASEDNTYDVSCRSEWDLYFQADNQWEDVNKSDHSADPNPNYHEEITTNESLDLASELDVELKTLLSQTIAGVYGKSGVREELRSRKVEHLQDASKNRSMDANFSEQTCDTLAMTATSRAPLCEPNPCEITTSATEYEIKETKKKRGRPKGSKTKKHTKEPSNATNAQKKVTRAMKKNLVSLAKIKKKIKKSKFIEIFSTINYSSSLNSFVENKPKRPRGRPKGSKNSGIPKKKSSQKSKLELRAGKGVQADDIPLRDPLDIPVIPLNIRSTNNVLTDLDKSDNSTTVSTQQRPRQEPKARRGRRCKTRVLRCDVRNKENIPEFEIPGKVDGKEPPLMQQGKESRSGKRHPFPNWSGSTSFPFTGNHSDVPKNRNITQEQSYILPHEDWNFTSGSYPNFYSYLEEESKDGQNYFVGDSHLECDRHSFPHYSGFTFDDLQTPPGMTFNRPNLHFNH